jgi:hypothetical protein
MEDVLLDCMLETAVAGASIGRAVASRTLCS